MSEHTAEFVAFLKRVYQVFRWWGVGTCSSAVRVTSLSVSSVPMVGCRNCNRGDYHGQGECIKCSDGGVSEPTAVDGGAEPRVYQVFRWWGVGTCARSLQSGAQSVSSVPMVGCRNLNHGGLRLTCECIKCSDGGVSEPRHCTQPPPHRVYQVFRWWGVGTDGVGGPTENKSVSSVPMVGCRNQISPVFVQQDECIKCSDGEVAPEKRSS